MKNKNIKFIVIAILIAAVFAIGLTYAYFTADITNTAKVTSNVTASNRDVFVASGSSILETEVTNAFMSKTAGKDDYSVSIEKSGTITVSLTAGSDTATCKYDLAISNAGSVAYTKSPDAGDLLEYTVQGTDDSDTPQTFAEINVDAAMGSSITPTTAQDSSKQVNVGILGNYTISDDYDEGTQVAKNQTWTIKTNFYNLNKLQDAQAGNTYSYDVKVVNVACTNSSSISSEEDNENQVGTSPTVVSGDTSTVGSEIAIGDEHFYVISSDDTTVTLLSKYNLLVGNVYDSSLSLVSTYDGTEEGYGLQSETAKGYVSGASQYIATVAYDSSRDADRGYWVDSSYNLLESYGSSYPAWVYDDNATIKTYVDNYKTLLESNYGISINKARLIKREELVSLGCETSTCNTATVINNKREWVYSTTYWSGSAYDDNNMWIVGSYGQTGNGGFTVANMIGVRPVIILSKSEF